jgi:hypothetical protein
MTPKHDNYNWVTTIILSCKNTFHYKAVDIIIDLFNTMYADDGLTTSLKDIRNQHYNKTHNIIN